MPGGVLVTLLLPSDYQIHRKSCRKNVVVPDLATVYNMELSIGKHHRTCALVDDLVNMPRPENHGC
ncbi:unnamed protein product [Fusarium graminearum]|uniref:Uncharacterized protein n=1 Tax=Gibberella zeae TaxID=5518 RepID=A0A4E9EGM7_GIBZA|nr:unnamed protein product [Fusarium graminearum]CAF3586074.1 unnamed protein product [Fusarium graminearum]CAG1987157.1 unnamed protein product [Fusarium graminearum]